MISVLLSSLFATSARTTVVDTLVDREQRFQMAAVHALDAPRSEQARAAGGCGSSAGLSETSASLKFGGFGSGSKSNA